MKENKMGWYSISNEEFLIRWKKNWKQPWRKEELDGICYASKRTIEEIFVQWEKKKRREEKTADDATSGYVKLRKGAETGAATGDNSA